jgi:hypothetical protein
MKPDPQNNDDRDLIRHLVCPISNFQRAHSPSTLSNESCTFNPPL